MNTEATATDNSTQNNFIARRERRTFTPDFKAAACERIRQGASFVDVSSDLKVHEHLLREWTKKAGIKRGDALRPTPTTSPQNVGQSSKGVNKSSRAVAKKKKNLPERRVNNINEGDRMRSLIEENKALREENEFVKRVARMFASAPMATNTNRTKTAANG